MSKHKLLSWVILAWVSLACQPQSKQEEPLFRLISPQESGIHFRNDLTNEKLDILSYMYYYNGGGVASGDFNNDGLIDLFFTANETQNKLYLNKGNLTFEDITESAGVGGVGDWTTGVTLADINNDGYLDIYVCQVGNFKNLEGKNLLYINNGDLTFTEQAAQVGLDFSGFSTQAVFFDFDHDNDLDMYLLNHSVHGIHSYGSADLRKEINEAAGDRLYQNKSENGKLYFEDVSRKAGIFSSHIGYGLGVAVSDVNLDGWLDIYVANDFHENDYLYINQGNGTFKESLQEMIAYTSRYSMGCDIADLNDDGLPDIVTLDMLPNDPEILLKSASEDTQEVSDIKASYGYGPQYVRNCLQLNRESHFTEIAQYAGIHATDWSWSALIADYDNDASSEVFITNGIYKRPNDLDYIQYTSEAANLRFSTLNQDSIDQLMMMRLPTLSIPNVMYKNAGSLRFQDVSKNWGLDQLTCSNGMVYADLDNDGDLDLAINNVNQEAFVYENRTNTLKPGNYLEVELHSKENQFGIGARIVVHASGKAFTREMILSRGFQSSVSPRLHVGLGASTTIDSLEIFWNGNLRQVEKSIAVNQRIRIEKRDSISAAKSGRKSISEIEVNRVPVDIPFLHQENLEFHDYFTDPLMPYFLSAQGPAVAVADVNGDGLEDLYLGGAHRQPGVLLMQTASGAFAQVLINDFNADFRYEDVDAVFTDFNNDGFPDLYVVSGGGQYWEGNPILNDRLYLNTGKGNFIRISDALPELNVNGSCVRVADFDQDGYQDLFVGSRSVPGLYGNNPQSHILRNDGTGKFILHQSLAPGMVTDADWYDYDKDGDPDLVIAGDWRPITLLVNEGGKFSSGRLSGLEHTEGWWKSLHIQDLNNDGNADIISGNVGENIKLKPTLENPVWLYNRDFDDNGRNDPVIFYRVGERNIPFQSKSQLAKQMPFINKRFVNYLSFSFVKEPADLLPESKLKQFKPQSAVTFATTVWHGNSKNDFKSIALPADIQFSSVNDILVDDVDSNGIPDILLVGNEHTHSVNLGNTSSQSIVLLLGNSAGEYNSIPLADGLTFNQTFRKIKRIVVQGKVLYLLVPNNGKPQIISIGTNAIAN
ncbi:MAG: VCBS repeat-containing protein [Cyclobacteriaceae bacterium]|nr:VCBS repeat-containing protein [Cyclobacteriaceae bacterium]